MLRFAAILLLCLACSVSAAEEARPPVDSYGFDWLKPLSTSTRCQKMTPALLARFTRCNPSSLEYSFGLDFPSRVCWISESSEYLVYVTRKQCQKAFETMQANAP